MEGVAFGMRDNLELLRAQGVRPTEAVVGGGAANSPVWLQIITDIMGIPLYTVNTTEGGAFGAAILAAVGAGAWPNVPAACAQLVRRVSTTQPDRAGMNEYGQLYEVYRGLYPSLKATYSALGKFEGQ
jgi:xylulokinase